MLSIGSQYPQNLRESLCINSEWLAAASLIRTYGYMVESGVEYSYLVAGEAFVFLWYDEDEPHSLYYQSAGTNIEAEAQDDMSISCYSALR